MGKVFIDTGDGFDYIGDCPSLTIYPTLDPLDAEVVYDDLLDAEEIGTEPPIVING